MIKQKAVLEVTIGERCYQMECYSDAPLGEVHDALSRMKGYIIQRMVEAEKATEPKKED